MLTILITSWYTYYNKYISNLKGGNTMFIVKINFVSRKYNEEGTLTYRTAADTWQQAVEKGIAKAEQLNKTEEGYIHSLGEVIEFANLEWIE